MLFMADCEPALAETASNFEPQGLACDGYSYTDDNADKLMGTAHRSLPCGTMVEVCGDAGCASIPVIDRGPAEWTGRSFDLTYAAFGAICGGTGWCDVTSSVVGSESPGEDVTQSNESVTQEEPVTEAPVATARSGTPTTTG